MDKRSLVCAALAGGEAVAIDFEGAQFVSDLKPLIAKAIGYKFNPSELTLYLAKKDRDWFRSSDPDIKQLERGENVPDSIQQIIRPDGHMRGRYRLSNEKFGFPGPDCADEGQVHILVKLPEARAEARRRVLAHHRSIVRLALVQCMGALIYLCAVLVSGVSRALDSTESIKLQADKVGLLTLVLVAFVGLVEAGKKYYTAQIEEERAVEEAAGTLPYGTDQNV